MPDVHIEPTDSRDFEPLHNSCGHVADKLQLEASQRLFFWGVLSLRRSVVRVIVPALCLAVVGILGVMASRSDGHVLANKGIVQLLKLQHINDPKDIVTLKGSDGDYIVPAGMSLILRDFSTRQGGYVDVFVNNGWVWRKYNEQSLVGPGVRADAGEVVRVESNGADASAQGYLIDD